MRRRCMECHKILKTGYTLFFDVNEYYCSPKCIYTRYTPNEYKELYEKDQAYFTEWLDEDET